jgi:hypothetical protein
MAVTQRVLAREARLVGFVPMAADAFGAVLSQGAMALAVLAQRARDRGLRHRHEAVSRRHLALFKLATKDARPHLIVRGVTSELWRPRLVSPPIHVHESRPVDNLESPASLVARADALIEGGKFVDAEAAARWSILLSDAGDQSPARCALARSLIGQRRLLEARATLAPIDDGEAAALRARISRDVAEPRIEPAMVESFLEILRTCQESEDPSMR